MTTGQIPVLLYVSGVRSLAQYFIPPAVSDSSSFPCLPHLLIHEKPLLYPFNFVLPSLVVIFSINSKLSGVDATLYYIA